MMPSDCWGPTLDDEGGVAPPEGHDPSRTDDVEALFGYNNHDCPKCGAHIRWDYTDLANAIRHVDWHAKQEPQDVGLSND